MRIASAIAFLSCCVVAFASDPVDSSRLPYGGTWSGIVGVSGGIPNRTTIYTNLPSDITITALNSAIDNCPSNQVILLTNGNFASLGSGDINFDKNGVTIRGATNANGRPNTMLSLASTALVRVRNSASWDVGGTGFTTNSVTSGTNRGSTSLTVNTTPSVTVGTLMWIVALTNSAIRGGGWSDFGGDRPFSQAVKVTSVAGTTIGFTPPIQADYLTNGAHVAYRSFSDQIVLSGFENIIFTNAAGSFASGGIVGFYGADQCWLKNCKLLEIQAPDSLNCHVYMYLCYGVEVRECEIAGSTSLGSSTYGMASVHCSSLFIEDNIFHDLPNMYPLIATSVSAFTYNYIFDEPYGSPAFLSQIVFHHGSHNHFVLFEGNYLPTHYNDGSYTGNESHSIYSMYLRQRLTGYDTNGPKTDNLHAITFEKQHDYATVVGCVMGTSGKQTDYFSNGTIGTPHAIFNFDTTSSNTCFRRFNYNTIDSGIHTGETLAGGEEIVTSYLHASKPNWFGDRPWPWVDPNNFAQSDAPTNFPAGFRYQFGTNPPAATAGVAASRAQPIRLRLRP